MGARRRVDVQQGACHGAGRHGPLQGALLADAGEAGVSEGGEGVAEVDVVLLLAVRQPRVRPFALGEPVWASAVVSAWRACSG